MGFFFLKSHYFWFLPTWRRRKLQNGLLQQRVLSGGKHNRPTSIKRSPQCCQLWNRAAPTPLSSSSVQGKLEGFSIGSWHCRLSKQLTFHEPASWVEVTRTPRLQEHERLVAHTSSRTSGCSSSQLKVLAVLVEGLTWILVLRKVIFQAKSIQGARQYYIHRVLLPTPCLAPDKLAREISQPFLAAQ